MAAQIDIASVPPLAASATAETRERVRLASIDTLRGLVIVLMVLDHARDYFGFPINPLNIAKAGEAIFLTRWVTHLCAPSFIFLAGVSAYLMSQHMTKGELSRFLLKRGLWLVLLELVVINFCWTFNFQFVSSLLLTVIWAIGLSMIVLAALVHLPMRAIATLCIVVIAGHNLLDGITPDRFGALAPLWTILHVPGMVSTAFVAYPLIPWFAVMGLGYVMGSLYHLDPQRRIRLLTLLGVGALALFILLRLPNVYGDPFQWKVQSSFVHTILFFVNVQKYPPSLQFLLLTLGAAFLLLAAFESCSSLVESGRGPFDTPGKRRDFCRASGKFTSMLRTFGRVPLFFFLLHIPLLHLGAGLLALASGFGGQVLFNSFAGFPRGWGFGLPVVYLAWALALVVLYPLCKWYGELKRRRKDWWLAYL